MNLKAFENILQRIFRYFLTTSSVMGLITIIMIISNSILKVYVSISFYILIATVLNLIFTTLICIYNSKNLKKPLTKPLIIRLNRNRLKRARKSKKKAA